MTGECRKLEPGSQGGILLRPGRRICFKCGSQTTEPYFRMGKTWALYKQVVESGEQCGEKVLNIYPRSLQAS